MLTLNLPPSEKYRFIMYQSPPDTHLFLTLYCHIPYLFFSTRSHTHKTASLRTGIGYQRNFLALRDVLYGLISWLCTSSHVRVCIWNERVWYLHQRCRCRCTWFPWPKIWLPHGCNCTKNSASWLPTSTSVGCTPNINMRHSCSCGPASSVLFAE